MMQGKWYQSKLGCWILEVGSVWAISETPLRSTTDWAEIQVYRKEGSVGQRHSCLKYVGLFFKAAMPPDRTPRRYYTEAQEYEEWGASDPMERAKEWAASLFPSLQ